MPQALIGANPNLLPRLQTWAGSKWSTGCERPPYIMDHQGQQAQTGFRYPYGLDGQFHERLAAACQRVD